MNPYISILGKVIPTYGLCMVIGVLISAGIAIHSAKRIGMDENSLIVVMASAMGLALVGAKLLYIIVSYGFITALKELASLNLTAISQSGFVFYGGLIFGTVSGFAAAKLLKEDAEAIAGVIAPVIPLGHAFGRLGCYFAGCCYGLPYSGTLAVKLSENGIEYSFFPIQLVEALANLLIFALLMIISQKLRGYRILSLYFIVYALLRFIIEFFRGDKIRGLSLGISTSQWISVALLLIGSIGMIIYRKRIRATTIN